MAVPALLRTNLKYQLAMARSRAKCIHVNIYFSTNSTIPPKDNGLIEQRNDDMARNILIKNKIDILYQDNHIIVCNKPNNLLCQSDHKTEECHTLLGLLKSYIKCKFDKKGDVYLGLVHRLDRPCSGAIVLARTSKAAARLSEQFRERTPNLKKTYICVVEGQLLREGVCENYVIPTATEKVNFGVKVEVKKKGPSNCFAKLCYTPLLQSSLKHTNEHGKILPLTLVNVELETGRKHQIRAQLAHIGHPLFGDLKYGSRNKMPLYSVALHARELTVAHPVGKQQVMSAIIAKCR